jgi:hypothetical protein
MSDSESKPPSSHVLKCCAVPYDNTVRRYRRYRPQYGADHISDARGYRTLATLGQLFAHYYFNPLSQLGSQIFGFF